MTKMKKERQEGQEAEKEEERAGEREDEVKGKKETGKEETTDEKPLGLEDVESELKTTGEEEEAGCVESEQEAREEVRRTHEARVRQVRVAKAHEERREQESEVEAQGGENKKVKR